MKRIFIFAILAVLLCRTPPVQGAMTYGLSHYLANKGYVGAGNFNDPLYNFINEVETTIDGTSGVDAFIFTPGTQPTSTEGTIYYDSAANWFKGYDGTSWVTFASAAGNSLDSAYDLGNKIDVDGTVLELEVDNNSNNAALLLDMDDATNNPDVLQITSDSTGDLISLNGSTTGNLIYDEDGNFTVASTGALSAATITATTDLTMTGSNYNVIWDSSSDQLEFNDGAEISFGTGEDVTIEYDGSGDDLNITGATKEIAIGADAGGLLLVIHTDTSGDYVQFDEENVDVDFVDVDLDLDDNSYLRFGSSDDITMKYDGSNNDLDILGSGLEIAFGADDEGIDLVWHTEATGDAVTFDESGSDIDVVDVDIGMDDDANLTFGSSDDVTIGYDGSNNDLDITSTTALDEISFGATGDGYDLVWHSTTSGDYVLFDYSADAVLFEDNEIFIGDGEGLYFGDAVGTGDFKISDETDVLTIAQVVADTGEVAFGADGTDVPITWYAETASDFVKFTGDDLQLEDVSLCIAESTQIQFGDALGTGDITLSCASNVFTIGQVVAGTGSVALGVDDAGVDFTLYGDTASQKAWWDASGDQWYWGADAEGVDVTFYADTTGDYMKWDEDSAAESLTLVDVNAVADNGSYILDMGTSGTKVLVGTPVIIEFRPTAGETLTWKVPSGVDLLITDAWGHKIAAAGSGANDDLALQNNDGSAAAIFDTEELDSVADKARFQFDNLDDAEAEIEGGDTLQLVAQEASSVDCIVYVSGIYKTAD